MLVSSVLQGLKNLARHSKGKQGKNGEKSHNVLDGMKIAFKKGGHLGFKGQFLAGVGMPKR